MRESYVKSKGLSDNYNFDSETIGFGVEITYSNVFGASTTILTSFYLYYGHVSGT
jgi:hypothetical protein